MQQTRAEYYEDLTLHWLQMLKTGLYLGYSLDYIVSTARMLAHFGQVALSSKKKGR